ncbi:MAG: relaxase/mobilization nuclease domain-containing protein [Burkholderiales bacterium]|nr:relaxase/mobilization nuclease domain-containing protein [Burkholderiales bacterium]
MPKRTVRVPREGRPFVEPGSHGRRANVRPLPGFTPGWAGRMQASFAGASEVMVKVTGGGRDAGGVAAHMAYIDRHGKLELETDEGRVLQGKGVAQALVRDWGLDYGEAPGAPHSRRKRDPGEAGEARQGPKQAFNIILSMPPGTGPEKVLLAAKKFARENFAYQHRYALALHDESVHGKHPHVHLVVKAEHDYGGKRLNPRKADLVRWREQFAEYLNELGVAATATRRHDRGLAKTTKKGPIHRAAQRPPRPERASRHASDNALFGDSSFVQRQLVAVAKELKAHGTIEDQTSYRQLLDLRGEVVERYREAAAWCRSQGRETEAARFERELSRLPPVRTEKQMLAERVFGAPPPQSIRDGTRTPSRNPPRTR